MYSGGIVSVSRERATEEGITLRPRRNVYPSHQIPHLWAHGIPKDRRIRSSSNVYAEGDTIYSFGDHFPMAKRVVRKGQVIFLYNPDRYSSITDSHQSAVHRAIPSANGRGYGPTIDIPPGMRDSSYGYRAYSRPIWDQLVKGNSENTITYFNELIVESTKNACAKRIRLVTRQRHLDDIERHLAQWRHVHATFGLRCKLSKVKATESVTLEAVGKLLGENSAELDRKRKAQDKRNAARLEAQRLEQLRRAALAQEMLKEWRRGGPATEKDWDGVSSSIYDLGYHALRINGDEVETSGYASVPLSHVERLYKRLPRLLTILNGHARSNVEGEPLGHFRLDTLTQQGIEVGCHRIPWFEVRAFLTHYGWAIPEGLPK